MGRPFTTSVCIAALLLVAAVPAKSQVLLSLLFGDKLNTPELEFGLNISANFATMSGLEGSRYRTDLNIGFYFDQRLTDRSWILAEVLVKSRAGTKNLPAYELGEQDLDEVLEGSKVERQISYFQVPIMYHYKFRESGFSIALGIQPALRSRAFDVFVTSVFQDDDVNYRNDIRDNYTRFDFGLTSEIAWRPKRTVGVSIVAGYSHGLVNVLKDDSLPAQRNRQFLVGARVPIGVKAAERKRAEKAAEEADEQQENSSQQ